MDGAGSNSMLPSTWLLGIGRRQELSEVVLGWLVVAEEALLLKNEGKERAAAEVWGMQS